MLYDLMLLLTDWFAQKNVDDTVIFNAIFIIGTVRFGTDYIVPLQSGNVTR